MVPWAQSITKDYIGAKRKLSLSPSYSFHKSLYHKPFFFFSLSLSQTTAKILSTISERKRKLKKTHVLEPFYTAMTHTKLCLKRTGGGGWVEGEVQSTERADITKVEFLAVRLVCAAMFWPPQVSKDVRRLWFLSRGRLNFGVLATSGWGIGINSNVARWHIEQACRYCHKMV